MFVPRAIRNIRPTDRNRGLTLVEVMLAAAVLSTAILSVFSLYVNSERMLIVSREDSVALYAAQDVINEIRSAPFTSTDPGVKTVADYHHETRPVNLAGPLGPNDRMGVTAAPVATGTPDGLKVENELGIVIINEDKPRESNFGDVDGDGDLDFPIDLNLNGSFMDHLNTATATSAFPRDLGGDGGLDDAAISHNLLRIAPVCVIIRWTSKAGIERRVQLVTFIGDRAGGF